METSVRAAQAERVLRPAGGIGRHHIEMPRQKHPAFGLRADAGKQVEPVAVLMRVPPAGDAMAGEIGFYMTDDIAVRTQADAGKADKVGKNGDAALAKRMRRGAHVPTTCTCCGKSHSRSQPPPRT